MIINQAIHFRASKQEQELGRRPRLLFLARQFPPLKTVACVRTWNIAKYLARLAWDVTIVTPQPSVWRHVECPEATNRQLRDEGIRRILTGHSWRFLEPNLLKCWNRGPGWAIGGIGREFGRRLGIVSGIGWIKSAERACSTLTPDDVDVILASGMPFAAFRLAKRLSDKLHRPYVLDYRDPWTENPYKDRPAQATVIQEEARLLADCAAVTIVSPSWREAMDRCYGLGSKLHIVSNGYDPEELTGIELHDFGHFAIVYTGNFYPPKRVISPVLAALQRLKTILPGQDSKWRFHYYGGQGDHVRAEAECFGVTEQVVLHGSVPRSEALAAVKSAGVAVVITVVADEATMADRGMMTAKVFEPLGLGTPILLVAPPGSDVEVLAEATGLAHRFTGSEVAGMAACLADLISGQTVPAKVGDTYAWTNIARRLDAVLREAVDSALYKQRR
jgi:hypothetical protein